MTGGRERSVGRPSVTLVAALLAALAGGAAGRISAGPATTRQKAAAALPTAGPSRDGAASAATADVLALASRRALAPASRDEVLRAIAAPEMVPALAGRVAVSAGVEQATGLAADLAAGRPIAALTAPLATRVISYSGLRAVVEVWTVSVLGTARLGAADASWSTETVRLAWAEDRWKVAGYASRGGPVPLSPQPPTGLASVLATVSAVPEHADGTGE